MRLIHFLFVTMLPALVCTGLLILTQNDTQAQTFDWRNASNNNSYWHLVNNWAPLGPPQASETARFNLDQNYEVWWDSATGNRDVGSLAIDAGDVTFLNLDSSPSYRLRIQGSGGDGSLSDFSASGASTKLFLDGVSLLNLGGAQIIDGARVYVFGSQSAGGGFFVSGSSGFDISGWLDVYPGANVSTTDSYIGRLSGSNGVVNVFANGQWDSTNVYVGGSDVATGGTGTLSIINSQVDIAGVTKLWDNGTLNLQTGGELRTGSFINESGTLNIAKGTLVVNEGIFDPGVNDFYLDGGAAGLNAKVVLTNGASTQSIELLAVGSSNEGEMLVSGGSTLSSQGSLIGYFQGSTGLVTVSGEQSNWDNFSYITVGGAGIGQLTVENTGQVEADTISIGQSSSGSGTATVTGENIADDTRSTMVSENLIVGQFGDGTLLVEDGGRVVNTFTNIATKSGSTGTVSITGDNARLASQVISIGGNGSSSGGTGTLNIDTGGTVSAGLTRIWSTGTVNLTGGRFDFGQLSFAEFAAINATSGSMSGRLENTGFTDVDSLTALQNTAVDLTDVRIRNFGTLYGQASLGTALQNYAAGEVEIVAGERMRFAGTGNTNAGEINNFGGTIRFDQDAWNQSNGFISGRGQFIANGGWTNEGVMAFSGTTDILGDTENVSSGQIITSGGAITTFYDDVVHNGAEIRTAAGSSSVFFGGVSGAGDFTGAGMVFFEGDLRPGNSPDIVAFEGDVAMGTASSLMFEIGGVDLGEFDQLDIAGNFFLDGQLQVGLIDGFTLAANQQFLVADVDGILNGQFSGFGEGDLVGTFAAQNLFISYQAGDGNDVGLFTNPVPEPGCLIVGVLGLVLLSTRRYRASC